MCTDIRIHPDAHRGYQAAVCSYLGDNTHLGRRFNIETADPGLEAQENFPIGLSNTGENDALRGKSGIQGGTDFSAADAIGSQAGIRYPF